MDHIIDAIATKHLLCITELNFGSYNVMIWLAQSTDNLKWFAWSPRLNESRLYIIDELFNWCDMSIFSTKDYY